MTSTPDAEHVLNRHAAAIRSTIETHCASRELALPEGAHVKVYGTVLHGPPPPSRVGLRSQMNLVICGADNAWAFANPDSLPRDPFSRVASDNALTLGRQLAELAAPYQPTWRTHRVVASLQYGPHLT